MSVNKIAAICLMLCMACLGTAWGQAEGPQRYFNLKAGPVYLVLSAGVDTEYTDNVNLANGKNVPAQSELTVYPNIGITAATRVQFLPLSETNTNDLRFSANIGYRDYLFHPQLSKKEMDINLSPDSELSFLIHAGHFKIRLHDGFSLQSDPTTDGSLSNVAVFRRFVNTVGVDTQWDVNSKTRVNFAYNHSNLYALSITALGTQGNTKTAAATTNLNTSRLNSSTDTVNLILNCQVLSLLNVGFSSSVQATSFPSAPDQDTTAYSYGPTANLRLSQYTTLTASYGTTQNRMGNVFTGTAPTTTTTNNNAVNTTTNYFDLTLANQLNTYYSHSLSVGRQVSLSLLGSQTETNYIRYNSTWRVNSHISIATGLFAENNNTLGTPGNLGALGTLVNSSLRYRRYGCTLSTSYRLSRRMYTTLTYRFINKAADDPLQSYKQNTITWTFNYQF